MINKNMLPVRLTGKQGSGYLESKQTNAILCFHIMILGHVSLQNETNYSYRNFMLKRRTLDNSISHQNFFNIIWLCLARVWLLLFNKFSGFKRTLLSRDVYAGYCGIFIWSVVGRKIIDPLCFLTPYTYTLNVIQSRNVSTVKL